MQSLSKNKLKYIRSLHLSKFRQKYNNFLVEGHKSVAEFLRAKKFEVEAVIATEAWLDKIDHHIVKNIKDSVFIGTKDEVSQAGLSQSGAEVVLILQQQLSAVQEVYESGKPVFYLDDVQDPGNVGTILRIADWFGFAGVIRSASSADFFNPKVVQASMGSLNNLVLAQGEPSELNNKSLVVLDMQGEAIQNWKFQANEIIVLGNEGNGAGSEVRSMTHRLVSIPGADTRLAESLNVAVSAGIVAARISLP